MSRIFSTLALLGVMLFASAGFSTSASAHGADQGARRMAACAMAQVETPYCEKMRAQSVRYLTEGYFIEAASKDAGMAACLADGFAQKDCDAGAEFMADGGTAKEKRNIGIFLVCLFGGVALFFAFIFWSARRRY